MSETVRLSTNWKQSQGTLSPVIIKSPEEANFENIVQEHCVLLTENEEKERCEIVIHGNFDLCILITDSPRWEVIGNIQYLFTKTGQLLEEIEGSKVYNVKIDLGSRTFDKITLRLPPSVQSCWLYGIFVKCSDKRRTIAPPPTQHFNIHNINNLLADSSQISSNAEKFKDLFDTFQRTGPLQSALLASSNPTKDNPPQYTQSTIESSTNLELQSNIPLLKMYIDSKFQDLETKIVSKIEENEKLQNAKLDKIIDLLEKRNL